MSIKTLKEIDNRLNKALRDLEFLAPVNTVLNPLEYAFRAREKFFQKYGKGSKEILLLGMNPGPWGMAQTGIPFGDVVWVRDWMKIEAKIDRPRQEHPKRPIQGFSCTRREGSGSRLWEWAANIYPDAKDFFERFFVVNYCPLCFMEDSGRNRTPDKLPKDCLLYTSPSPRD